MTIFECNIKPVWNVLKGDGERGSGNREESNKGEGRVKQVCLD